MGETERHKRLSSKGLSMQAVQRSSTMVRCTPSTSAASGALENRAVPTKKKRHRRRGFQRFQGGTGGVRSFSRTEGEGQASGSTEQAEGFVGVDVDVSFKTSSRVKPVAPGKPYPAMDMCSSCGLCDTYYVSKVKEACAFIGDGMSRIDSLEEQVHGRGRDLSNDEEVSFGVHDHMSFVKMVPGVEGAQWTGVITSLAIEMLRVGMVEAAVCVGSDPEDELKPLPCIATTKEEVLAARGVKPSLSPNLDVLADVERRGIKKLLFIGVGCQVQALRSIEKYLAVDKLYVVGTNCTDNGPREGLETFLQVSSENPSQVKHYEFMQDYRVHMMYKDGVTCEKVPYFCLPADRLTEVIATSCYSCFDYVNALADVVVGYMGVPFEGPDVPMTKHFQYVTIRNEAGREIWDMLRATERLVEEPTTREGQRQEFVKQTLVTDDDVQLGLKKSNPLPLFIGNILADVLEKIGPKGLEFAAYSIDYHVLRNFLLVYRRLGKEKTERMLPAYAKKIIQDYGDVIEPRLQLGKDAEPEENEGLPSWAFVLLFASFLLVAITLSVKISSFLIFHA